MQNAKAASPPSFPWPGTTTAKANSGRALRTAVLNQITGPRSQAARLLQWSTLKENSGGGNLVVTQVDIHPRGLLWCPLTGYWTLHW